MVMQGAGGRGGDAHVEGDNSTAEGGQGGDAASGAGGRGGDASVNGDNALAIGGRGGRGGIGPGGRGGDARVVPDQAELERLLSATEQEVNEGGGGHGGQAYAVSEHALNTLVVGGEGGESGQPSGRGAEEDAPTSRRICEKSSACLTGATCDGRTSNRSRSQDAAQTRRMLRNTRRDAS